MPCKLVKAAPWPPRCSQPRAFVLHTSRKLGRCVVIWTHATTSLGHAARPERPLGPADLLLEPNGPRPRARQRQPAGHWRLPHQRGGHRGHGPRRCVHPDPQARDAHVDVLVHRHGQARIQGRVDRRPNGELEPRHDVRGRSPRLGGRLRWQVRARRLRSDRVSGSSETRPGRKQSHHHPGNRDRANARREFGRRRTPNPKRQWLQLRCRLQGHGSRGRSPCPQRGRRPADVGIFAPRKPRANRSHQGRQLCALRQRCAQRGHQHSHPLPRRPAVDADQSATRAVQ